jgi:glycosyltransferase involved in cell wall biosynthesis
MNAPGAPTAQVPRSARDDTHSQSLLSVVIPSYNQGKYIRETIDSTLAQDYRPIEVLVMDGGSKDETVEVLKSYDAPELQWISEPDRGVVDAVNKGLARARGDVIAIQSSDDVYVPGAFTAAMDAIRGVGLVYGDVDYIDASSHVTGRTQLPPFDLYEYAGKLTYIPQPAAFFTAEAMRAAGAWREDISYAADAEFYLRIAQRFPVKKIDRVLARYRFHEEQRDKLFSRVERDWRAAVAPLTQSPDRRLRRYARSGMDLVRLRYAPESQWVRRTVAAYHAMLVNPAVLRSREFRATRDLFPGRYPIWRLLSRLKRALRR